MAIIHKLQLNPVIKNSVALKTQVISIKKIVTKSLKKLTNVKVSTSQGNLPMNTGYTCGIVA